jgi:hypothetical protein
MAKKEKVVVEEKNYSIKYVKYDDGSSSVERANDGFTAMELLGYMEQVQMEILEILRGGLKVTKTKRIAKTK